MKNNFILYYFEKHHSVLSLLKDENEAMPRLIKRYTDVKTKRQVFKFVIGIPMELITIQQDK